MDSDLKAIIIDDEKNARKVLANLLSHFCPQVQVCAETDNAADAYELIKEHNPQLVFLDIQMPTGNGFTLLKRFNPVPFEVIFVTSFDKYAINAIKFNALDYLLKPVEVSDLKEAVSRAEEKLLRKTPQQTQIVNLLNTLEDKSIEPKIAVHRNEKVLLIKVSDICFIESDDRYSNIHTIQQEKHLLTKTLKEFEEYLAGNSSFMRISKTAIININCIKDYSKGEPCVIQMQNGRSFEVSRRKKQEFLEILRGK